MNALRFGAQASLAVVLALLLGGMAQAETAAERDARMQWWREARFGMFIHWGLYCVPAGEYQGRTDYGGSILEQAHMPVSLYTHYANQFNPVRFDARAWVTLAKKAGMKYLVITSKHHEGFALYPSALTDWCIKSTPFGKSGRDPLKELSEACREMHVRFCVYYSIMDWHHPDWGMRRPWNDVASGTPDMDRYVVYMKGQLKELIDNYHPSLIWFDGEWEEVWTHERGLDLYAYLRGLDPSLIINERVDKGRTRTCRPLPTDPAGDYCTPEQLIPSTAPAAGVNWETCMTINDHWAFNKHDLNWKSSRTLLRNLIDVASKGGNYLLNVGPTREGIIPQPEVDRLEEIGSWLELNGDAIYGTTASPFKTSPPWGRFTQKPGKLYACVLDWPRERSLTVPIRNRVSRSYALSDLKIDLAVQSDGTAAHIQLPANAPSPMAAVIVLEYSGKIEPTEVDAPP